MLTLLINGGMKSSDKNSNLEAIAQQINVIVHDPALARAPILVAKQMEMQPTIAGWVHDKKTYFCYSHWAALDPDRDSAAEQKFVEQMIVINEEFLSKQIFYAEWLNHPCLLRATSN